MITGSGETKKARPKKRRRTVGREPFLQSEENSLSSSSPLTAASSVAHVVPTRASGSVYRRAHLSASDTLLTGLGLEVSRERVQSCKPLVASEADVRSVAGVQGLVPLAVVRSANGRVGEEKGQFSIRRC